MGAFITLCIAALLGGRQASYIPVEEVHFEEIPSLEITTQTVVGQSICTSAKAKECCHAGRWRCGKDNFGQSTCHGGVPAKTCPHS